MARKFGMSHEIYSMARSMHDFGIPGEEIMTTIRQTLELQDKPVDDKEIQRLVKAAILQADSADDTDDKPDCSECEYNPLSLKNLCRKPKQMRLYELKYAALREGIDPAFKILVEHAENRATARGIDKAFLTLMQALDADHISIDCDKASLTFKIAVQAGARWYTSTTDWDDNETTVRAYDATYNADSGLIEDLDLTDSYSTKLGTYLVGGHPRGGE